MDHACQHAGPTKQSSLYTCHWISVQTYWPISGPLQVNPVLLRPHPCFLEHVIDGLRLSVMFAIDFTEGNPEYEDRQCMHHELPGQAGSICQAVMTAVADVLCVSLHLSPCRMAGHARHACMHALARFAGISPLSVASARCMACNRPHAPSVCSVQFQ